MSKRKKTRKQPGVELTIKADALEKLRLYVDNCPAEISGFGKVRDVSQPTGKKEFELYDVIILPQQVSGADANMTEDDIAIFLTEIIRKKQNPAEYRVWWHSHNDFTAFFSGTDDRTIDQSTEFPYLISLVTNKAGDYEARIDTYKPRLTMPVKVLLEEFGNVELKNAIKKEIADKVTIKKDKWLSGFFDRDFRNGFGFQPASPKSYLPMVSGQTIVVNSGYLGQAENETDDQYFERLAHEHGGIGIIDEDEGEWSKGQRKKGRQLHTGMW